MVAGGPEPFQLAEKSAKYFLRLARVTPEVALVLGSGWQASVEALGEAEAEVPARALPGFAEPQVPGHKGVLKVMRVKGRPVLVLAGRAHLYEGLSPAEVVHPVRTAVLAGARAVVLTNAAGSLRADFGPGEVALVKDHINLTGAGSWHSGSAEPRPALG